MVGVIFHPLTSDSQILVQIGHRQLGGVHWRATLGKPHADLVDERWPQSSRPGSSSTLPCVQEWILSFAEKPQSIASALYDEWGGSVLLVEVHPSYPCKISFPTLFFLARVSIINWKSLFTSVCLYGKCGVWEEEMYKNMGAFPN